MKRIVLLVCLVCLVGCGHVGKSEQQRHKEIIEHLDNIEKALKHR